MAHRSAVSETGCSVAAPHNGSWAAGTLQFILDIEMLTHADYFVGTTNSGLPHVVDVLRFAVYNKDRATFVDASFQHQDWHSRMRRFWAAYAEGPARRLLSARWGSTGLTEQKDVHGYTGRRT